MIPVGLMCYVRKIHRDHEVALPAPGAGRRATTELSNAAPLCQAVTAPPT
jgi:hypothetical protein